MDSVQSSSVDKSMDPTESSINLNLNDDLNLSANLNSSVNLNLNDDLNSSANLNSSVNLNSSMNQSILNQSSVHTSSNESSSMSSSLDSSNLSSLNSGQEAMDCEIVEVINNSSNKEDKPIASKLSNEENKPVASKSSNSANKSKKRKRSKEEIDREKQERKLRKEREAEEKRLRKEERERQFESSRQKRIEKEKETEEKKRQLEEMKRIKEQERVEKEAEKELRKKERDEKKRIKDEKAAKRKEAEDKKKEAEEEKERKQEMIASKFTSFFKKISPQDKKNPKAGNFEIQKDQSIASYIPAISKDNFVIGAFDSEIIHQDTTLLYLDEIKSKKRMPHKYNKRQNVVNKLELDDLIFEGSQGDKKTYRAKLLQFHENCRPAYFGTWRKKSKCLSGKCPFVKDEQWFDYSVDSDEEWVEEGDEKGEELKDSDNEKMDDEEEEIDNDYELDEFFVPHGHLSEDENQDDEHFEIEEMPDGQKKRKLLTKEKLLIEERTKKLKILRPKAIGCLWMGKDEFENHIKFKPFEKYSVVFVK